MSNAETFANKLKDGITLQDEVISLDLGGFTIALRSNSQAHLDGLRIYFAHCLGSGPGLGGGAADVEVLALEGPADDLGLTFIDWQREPGKTGRKDAYYDLSDGRLVQKVRTGMVFLQSANHRIAAGPCLENDNQVINFINAQYMNWLQQNGALICHASGLVVGGGCLGMAGFSGGGKSTLMLQVLEAPRTGYLTNDRLFLKKNNAGVEALGIPKLPRINPGTIVSNPTLSSILSEERRAELLALPKDELWDLEEKYDVDVEAVYGAGKIIPTAPMKGFLILNWRRDSDEPCVIDKINIAERQELLAALMKSPGPFYQFNDGSFFGDDMELAKAPYLDALEGIDIWEARGKVDFETAAEHCRSIISR